jgi:hypothetical protein
MGNLANLKYFSPFGIGIASTILDALANKGFPPAQFIRGLFDNLQKALPNHGQSTIPAGFEGGQCDGVLYQFHAKLVDTNGHVYGDNPYGNPVAGAISSVSTGQIGQDPTLRIIYTNPAGQGSLSLGYTIDIFPSAQVTLVRVDGQPDNCGNPPPIPDPNSPFDPDLYLPVNLPVPIPPNLPVPIPPIPIPPWIPIPFPPPSLPNPNDPTGGDGMTKADGKKIQDQLDSIAKKQDQFQDQMQCVRRKICGTVGYKFLPLGSFTEAGAYLVPVFPYEKIVGVDVFVVETGIIKSYRFSYDQYYKRYYPSLGEVGFVSETNSPERPQEIIYQSQRIMADFLEVKAIHYWFPIGVRARLTAVLQVDLAPPEA